eukprot:210663-Prymnesium_polylepis.1
MGTGGGWRAGACARAWMCGVGGVRAACLEGGEDDRDDLERVAGDDDGERGGGAREVEGDEVVGEGGGRADQDDERAHPRLLAEERDRVLEVVERAEREEGHEAHRDALLVEEDERGVQLGLGPAGHELGREHRPDRRRRRRGDHEQHARERRRARLELDAEREAENDQADRAHQLPGGDDLLVEVLGDHRRDRPERLDQPVDEHRHRHQRRVVATHVDREEQRARHEPHLVLPELGP